MLNVKLLRRKQSTLDSFFKKPVIGKEPNDPQPGYTGLQTPVMVEDDEMAVDDALSSSASALFSD
jgi:hypothetical protein